MPSLQDALKAALTQPTNPLPLDDWEADDKQIINAKTQEKPMPNSAPVVNIQRTETNSVRFGITNNVTRDTFNFIRDNPGTTRFDAVKTLVSQGHKARSVDSLVSQLVRSGQVRRTESGALTALNKDYVPIKPGEFKKHRAQEKARIRSANISEGVRKAWAKRKAIEAKREEATVAQHVIAKEEPKQKYQPKAVPEGIAALQTTPTSLPLVELTADKILDTLGVRQAKLLFLELKKIFEE